MKKNNIEARCDARAFKNVKNQKLRNIDNIVFVRVEDCMNALIDKV